MSEPIECPNRNTGTSANAASASSPELVEVVDDALAAARAHDPCAGRGARPAVAAMVDRSHREAGVVQGSGEPAIPPRVLGSAVGHEDHASRLSHRPPAGEHLDAVLVDEGPFVHPGRVGVPRSALGGLGGP